jgi:hypothetical protein
MEEETIIPAKRYRTRKVLLWIIGVLFLLLASVSFYLYSNFNHLLSDALMKAFNSGIVSDVYEIKFEKLGVNLVTGNIQVNNVEFKPREKPLASYPYINSTLQLRTQKILLQNVDLYALLKTNILKLKSVDILEPKIEMKLNGKKYLFFPLKDTSISQNKPAGTKSFIESFLLKEFSLRNATVHINNEGRQRELNIKSLSFSLKDLKISQTPGKDLISNRQVDLSIGEITWRLKKQAVTYVSISEFKLKVDSLDMQNSADTAVYYFTNFSTGLKALDMHTADSLFHLNMQSFNVSYRDKSITLKGISFKPNISDAAMQRRFTYQTPVFSGTVAAINLVGLNFDSLIYANKIFVDEVVLDKLAVTIFKDQSKPIDKNKFPKYLGQQIGSIRLPIRINHLQASNVNLLNTEKKPDGGTGRVNVNRLTLDAKNITTLPTNQPLTVNADGFLENKAHAYLSIQFSYAMPQMLINGRVQKFNLPDLNSFLSSYTPVKVNKGIVDEVVFSAVATRTNSTGKMKFLYHDLEADVNLKNQAKWKSDVLAFVGNAVVSSSNPPSGDKPAKEVRFKVDRDMNKGFINIIIKSILAGFKETIVMSKENRKAYKQSKKEARKEAKKNRKGNQ